MDEDKAKAEKTAAARKKVDLISISRQQNLQS
jgi:hypothetical protein